MNYKVENETESKKEYLSGVVGFVGYIVTLIICIMCNITISTRQQVLTLIAWVIIDVLCRAFYTAGQKSVSGD